MWEILFVPVLVGNNVLRKVALNYADVHRRTCSVVAHAKKHMVVPTIKNIVDVA